MSNNGSVQVEDGIPASVPENSSQSEECENNASAYVQATPVVQESGPVLYSNVEPDVEAEEKTEEPALPIAVKDDPETVNSHDSLDSVFGPHLLQQEPPPVDDTSDSMDFLDSPSDSVSAQEEPKAKSTKLKGPISFSLKSRDTDTPTDKSKMTTLLLDDDSEEDSSEEAHTEKEDNVSRKKKTKTDESSGHRSKASPTEPEVKAPKPNSEFLEAKQAEERIRDKLLATARERLAQQRKEKQLQLEQQKREEQLKKDKQLQLDQQRKEKQLQLERKRKADLFLKMLKKKNPDPTAVVSHILASDKTSSSRQNPEFWNLPDASQNNRLLFPTGKLMLSTNNYPGMIPGIKTDWSSDSNQEMSGEEEPISVIGEKLSSDPETVEKQPSPVKQERKKKKKKRSRSKSRERSSRTDKSKSSRRNREKHRSRSPPRNYKQEKSKKEKVLPAAYALTPRSRSRSRSPRRYRQSFNHWSRRR